MTKLPVFSPTARIERLQSMLRQRIRGQENVLRRLIETISRRELDVTEQRGVREAFIFAGPTGVGKTLSALTLAESLGLPYYRFDCSEFKTPASYDQLFGKNGRLAFAYKKAPTGIWLWDEFEKGLRELIDLFLQGVDDGRVTLVDGRVLDLSGLYIILTTNLGSAALIGREDLPSKTLEDHVCHAIENWLKPEIRGRFEDPLVFRALSRETQAELARNLLDNLIRYNAERGRILTYAPEVVPFLILRSFSPRLGARPIRKTVDRWVGNAIVNNPINKGMIVVTSNTLQVVEVN